MNELQLPNNVGLGTWVSGGRCVQKCDFLIGKIQAMVGGYDAFDFECIFVHSECFVLGFIIFEWVSERTDVSNFCMEMNQTLKMYIYRMWVSWQV